MASLGPLLGRNLGLKDLKWIMMEETGLSPFTGLALDTGH